MKFSLFFVWLCFCVSQTYSERGLQSWVTDARYSLYPSLPNVAPQSQDEKCRAHSQAFLSDLRNKTLWAVKMWDSSAKSPVGIISGSIYHFGNFDECLKTEAPFKVQFCIAHVTANVSSRYWDFPAHAKLPPQASAWSYIAKTSQGGLHEVSSPVSPDFPSPTSGISGKIAAFHETKHFYVALEHRKRLNFVLNYCRQNSRRDISKVPRNELAWGLCTPASCDSADLQEAINAHLASVSDGSYNETTFGVKVYQDFCTKAEEYVEFTPWEIAFWVMLFTLILLTSSSTLMDCTSDGGEKKHSLIYKMWMLFSIKQNFGLVVPLKPTTNGPLGVFHGIKFISILLILYGHRTGVSISLSTMNYEVIEDRLIEESKMSFVHTDLVVDTFFFISGLLACYIMMDVYSKRFVNPIYSMMVRVSRLAPLYYFLLWFQSTAAFRLGSGPLWKGIAKNETEYCVDHWWANAFFFSNYYKTEEMCMPHSWFLPCEIHFFVIAALLIPTIVKFPRFGKILLGVLTVVSAAIPAAIIYVYKVEPMILFYFKFLTQPRKYDSFNKLYIKSHNRLTVYLIGLAVGLFLHYQKNSKTRISKKLTACGVLAWLAFLFAPMAYGSLYYDLEKTFSPIQDALFGSLRRISWALGFSCFILAHRFGTIPFADFLFSSRLAVFCSRITYGIYLIHFNLITVDILRTRTARVFSVHDVFFQGIADLIKSILATLVLLFILEIPLKRMLREYIFAKQVKQFQSPSNVQNVWTVRL